MKRNNNISKPIYDEMKVDEAVKLAMSETPQEELSPVRTSNSLTFSLTKIVNSATSLSYRDAGIL